MGFKVGIAGIGKIGERHLAAYSNIENVEVSGLYDADRALSLQKAKEAGIRCYDSLDRLIEDNVDIVDVCVPTQFHHTIILKALEKGKHIFCEKPLTYRLDYAREIQSAAERYGKKVMVGYLYRFHPAFELLKTVLDKDVIGKPYYALFRLGGRGGHRAWKHQTDTGGGAVLDMLTHMLDLSLYSLGAPVEVAPLFSGVILKERIIDGEQVQVDAEDCVSLRMKTASGAQVFLQGDLITPSFTNIVEVHGDNGSFFGSIVPQFPTIVFCKEARAGYRQGENIQNFPQANLIEKELRYFINCVRTGAIPTSSIQDSITITEIVEEIRRQQHG